MHGSCHPSGSTFECLKYLYVTAEEEDSEALTPRQAFATGPRRGIFLARFRGITH